MYYTTYAHTHTSCHLRQTGIYCIYSLNSRDTERELLYRSRHVHNIDTGLFGSFRFYFLIFVVTNLSALYSVRRLPVNYIFFREIDLTNNIKFITIQTHNNCINT